jgi:hypothetical protein
MHHRVLGHFGSLATMDAVRSAMRSLGSLSRFSKISYRVTGGSSGTTGGWSADSSSRRPRI